MIRRLFIASSFPAFVARFIRSKRHPIGGWTSIPVEGTTDLVTLGFILMPAKEWTERSKEFKDFTVKFDLPRDFGNYVIAFRVKT